MSTLVVSLEYVSPIALTIYVLPQAEARLDTTGRYAYIPDSVSIAEAVSRTVSKGVSDVAAITDVASVVLEKLPVDSVSLVENFSYVFTYARALADSFGVVDASALSIGKVLAHTVSVPDQLSRQVSKLVVDVAVTTDRIGKTLARPVADTFSVADAVYLTPIKVVGDTVSAADVVDYSILKGQASSVQMQDVTFYAGQKFIADGVAMNDSFDAGDGAVMVFSKGVSNVIMVGDVAAKQSSKPFADSAATTSSGVVTVQGYCDISYFLEDYVGESRVF